MHRLHKADVRHHRLFVRRQRIGDQGRSAHRVLHRVEQGQAGKDANGQLLLGVAQGGPGLDVIRQGHLFRQPEVAGQAVPHLQILIIFNLVPVNGVNP
ncbi:hypothetical protein D3C76_1413410 [compost metagenome]